MSKVVVELNESNFHAEVLRAEEPVLVEFWAAWSAPCRNMAPLLESVAEDRAGQVKVATVNVERHEGLAEEYGVRGVPTFLIFNRGRLRDQIVGRTTERELHETLERVA